MTTILAEQARYVYAFEADPNNFKQLEQNTKHLDNVESHPIALSDTIGDHVFYTCPKDNGMNRMYKSKWCEDGETLEVPVSTIDVIFLMSHFTHKINFVKMDVEGWEYHVIMGMVNIIQRDHPTILLEFHPPTLQEAKCNPKDLYDLLRYELGYNDPILVGSNNNEVMTSYNQLFEITNNCPALNLLWKHNDH
jgi:FkbM family methyltransferase